jgi:creatinine amidohydrolase
MGQIFMGVSVESSEYLRSFEEQHKDDYHAGWVETSSMMDIDEQYVRDGYKEYPDSKITDKDMIFKKKQLRAMGKYGYIGSPRYASKELGEELNENCIETIYDAAHKFYERKGYEKYEHYMLYKILPLHIGFIAGKVRRKKVAG